MKNPTLTLNFSLQLSMNMEYGTQLDVEYAYKLFKKHNYWFGSDIKKSFVVLIFLDFV